MSNQLSKNQWGRDEFPQQYSMTSLQFFSGSQVSSPGGIVSISPVAAGRATRQVTLAEPSRVTHLSPKLNPPDVVAGAGSFDTQQAETILGRTAGHYRQAITLDKHRID